MDGGGAAASRGAARGVLARWRAGGARRGGEQRCSARGRGVQAAAWKLFGREWRREPEARARDIYDMWVRDFS